MGDSHTHGYFGEHLFKDLRTENSVSIFAAGGSNAQGWFEGWEAPWGYWEVRNNQVIKTVAWNSGQKVPVPRLADLQKQLDPDVVVIALGSNHFWFIPENEDMAYGSVARLMGEVQNFKNSSGHTPTCIWIAPPMYATHNANKFGPDRIEAFYQKLLSLKSSCWIFTESRNYTATGLDGIHFHFPNGNWLASQWAARAASFVRSH